MPLSGHGASSARMWARSPACWAGMAGRMSFVPGAATMRRDAAQPHQRRAEEPDAGNGPAGQDLPQGDGCAGIDRQPVRAPSTAAKLQARAQRQ